MSDRKIGKVISVNSFRIVVQLEDNLKSMYKSGFNDIYEIARINSYLIIPIGADRIVAIVTQVRIQDETEIEKGSSFITLPKAQRYLVATMIGTIENDQEYKQGVYNYPILDNPVWYVVKEDLDKIFDTALNQTYNYSSDYYLPIGTSPAFSDYKIRINPDKFFGKHAAILGNTGSGKSCTVASILQSIFSFKYNNDSRIANSHFIIFDTNGEYKRAFIGDDDQNKYADRALVNTFYIDKEGLQVPFWFMNFDDFDFLFEPSPNTQAPILKRAIGLAKNTSLTTNAPLLTKFLEKGIFDLADLSPDDLKKKKCTNSFGNWTYNPNNDIIDLSLAILPHGNPLLTSLQQTVAQLGSNINRATENTTIITLKQQVSQYLSQTNQARLSLEKNIDLPIRFEFERLITTHFDEAIAEQDNSSNRIREFVSTLRLRLQSYLNDERIANPLMLNNKTNITEGLAKFLAFILGDFLKVNVAGETDLFSTYYNSQTAKTGPEKLDNTKSSQITIIDMSLLPFEVLETVTGLIGRLILEFQSRFKADERGKMPVVIVLEEAQNYIPEHDRKDKTSISKKVFERIAREGRKYGLSLLVSSQRPSELSKTVLSQCNSFIVHRLQNPDDQKYVRQLVSAANEDILQQLPILPQQNAIIMGDCVRTPVQMKVNNAHPTPNSENPKFIENWLRTPGTGFPDYKNISKAWEEGISIDEYLNRTTTP
jgi:ABC-type dipeptide/oligopeptide/nickel transport system ATPase component